MRDITIIGGGLAGLISAILLRRSGYDVVLVEKKHYPFHKVCGEYVSNEVIPFFTCENLLPKVDFAQIDSFKLSAINGKYATLKLDLGGFGISRYCLDNHLYEIAHAEGVECLLGKSVTEIDYFEDHHRITIADGSTITSRVIIGAYGKRSKVDKHLKRNFIERRSPYIGVKYHIKHDHPKNEVALHNFHGGYCGINAIENGVSNLCYLSTRSNLQKYGDIPTMEKEVLAHNPFLKDIFDHAEFLFDKPEVINEISFETKKPVEDHIFMCGDAAGMIAPLCGNGMAMAIHSAKMLSDCIITHFESNNGFNRTVLESEYSSQWRKFFARRLSVGRNLQKLFGAGTLSGFTVGLMKTAKPIAHFLMEKTHGKPF